MDPITTSLLVISGLKGLFGGVKSKQQANAQAVQANNEAAATEAANRYKYNLEKARYDAAQSRREGTLGFLAAAINANRDSDNSSGLSISPEMLARLVGPKTAFPDYIPNPKPMNYRPNMIASIVANAANAYADNKSDLLRTSPNRQNPINPGAWKSPPPDSRPLYPDEEGDN